MNEQITGALFKQMVLHGAASITAQKQAINDLNVFPVPDGDTGTNMSMTISTAVTELRKAAPTAVTQAADLTASALLRGARGNSGVILSLLFRGLSKGLKGVESADAATFSAAMQEGVSAAYKAVMKPAEGTVLTVSRLAAKEAVDTAGSGETDLEKVLEAAIRKGYETLAQTTDMNPVLKRAGVVDAGGKGYLLILEGMLAALRGEPLPEITEDNGAQDKADFAALSAEDITFTFDTVFIVRKTVNTPLEPFRAYLNSIGDSLVIGEDDEAFKVHVHTDHPGMAIEKALSIGSLSGLKIDNMREQHTNKIDFESEGKAAVKAEPEEKKEHKETGFISVCSGSGIADIFKSLGVDVIIEGGQTMNPSTEDILNAINNIDADNIVIMPNNKNIILAAEQARNLTEDKKVFVIPTKSMPESISAMLCYNAEEDIDSVVEEMKDAIANVNTASVTYAVRDTKLGDKEIAKGDILGMLNDNIEIVGKDIQQSTKDLINEAVNDDSEIICIYYGSDATEEMANEIAEYAEENFPDCDIEVHSGNQQLYYYIISVE